MNSKKNFLGFGIDMADIIATVKDVSKNWNVYDKYSENLYIKNKQKSKLIQNNPEYKLREENIRGKANSIINAIKIMDNRSENYAENIEMAMQNTIGLASTALMLPFVIMGVKVKNTSKAIIYTSLSFIPAFILPLLLAPIEAKMQVKASRLGRYKAMKEDLNNINSFVSYTPEQIKEATEIVEKAEASETDKKTKNKSKLNKKDKVKKNTDANTNQSFKESIKQILNFSKDYKEYKKEQTLGINKEFQDKLNKNYTPEEIQIANENKELILHSSRIINNKAEDYSENTENAFQTLSMLELLLTMPLMYVVNKLIKAFSSPKNVTLNKSLGQLATLTFSMILIIAGTSSQKNAARVGRYKAQEELKKDLSPIVYFNDNELKSAGEVENDYKKVSPFKKIYYNLKFIKTYFKDLKEFNKYKKTEAKKEAKIFAELKKMEKSPEQIKEAEELKEKTFFAFKEIDEMSQSYSENMEAVTNILQTVLSVPFSLGPTLLFYYGTYQFLEGKLNIPKYGKLIANFALDKNSVIRTSLNELQEASKKDKSIKKLINQFINSNERAEALEKLMQNKETREPISKLTTHLLEILPQLNDNIETVIRNEVKKNKFSNYLINLGKDILNLITNKRAREINRLKKANKYTENVQDEMLMNIRKQIQESGKAGKTLKNTLIIGGVPILSLIVLIPFAISSIFTNIQKKSGRIGVMKATNTLDKPEYFT